MIPAWIQLLMWLMANMPQLIKSIREIIDIFNGDAKAAKECLAGLDESCKIDLRRTRDLGILRNLIKRKKEK